MGKNNFGTRKNGADLKDLHNLRFPKQNYNLCQLIIKW